MEQSKYKLIVFDLDGTLLDTLADLTASVNYAMQQVNLPQYSDQQVRWMVGNGVEVLMQRAVTQSHMDKYNQALNCQKQYYSAHSLDKTRPYDGIIQMLDDLNKANVKVGVFSNKDDAVAVQLCRDFFGDRVFYALGTKPNSAKKPNPFGVLEIIKRCGCTAEQTLYSGDSDVDIQTAANAQIPCISVTWGFRDKQFLQQHGATVFADTPSQVVDYILQR